MNFRETSLQTCAPKFRNRGAAPKLTRAPDRPEDARDLRDSLDWLAARGRSPKTYVTYREAVLALSQFASAKGMPLLADLRREHIEDSLRSM